MLRLNQDEFEFPILAIIRQSYINHSIIKPKDGDEINFQKMAVKIVKEYSDLDLAGKIAELLGILYSIQNESIRYKLIEKLFALPDIYSVMQLDKIINNTMKAVNAKEITNDNLSIVMDVPHELFNSFSENIPAYIEIITQDQTEQIGRFLFNLFIAKYPEHELPADLINIIALKINKRLESANAEPIQQALVKLFDAPMYVWLLVISIAVKMDITLDALPTAISILADLTACKVLTLKHQNLFKSIRQLDDLDCLIRERNQISLDEINSFFGHYQQLLVFKLPKLSIPIKLKHLESYYFLIPIKDINYQKKLVQLICRIKVFRRQFASQVREAIENETLTADNIDIFASVADENLENFLQHHFQKLIDSVNAFEIMQKNKDHIFFVKICALIIRGELDRIIPFIREIVNNELLNNFNIDGLQQFPDGQLINFLAPENAIANLKELSEKNVDNKTDIVQFKLKHRDVSDADLINTLLMLNDLSMDQVKYINKYIQQQLSVNPKNNEALIFAVKLIENLFSSLNSKNGVTDIVLLKSSFILDLFIISEINNIKFNSISNEVNDIRFRIIVHCCLHIVLYGKILQKRLNDFSYADYFRDDSLIGLMSKTFTDDSLTKYLRYIYNQLKVATPNFENYWIKRVSDAIYKMQLDGYPVFLLKIADLTLEDFISRITYANNWDLACRALDLTSLLLPVKVTKSWFIFAINSSQAEASLFLEKLLLKCKLSNDEIEVLWTHACENNNIHACVKLLLLFNLPQLSNLILDMIYNRKYELASSMIAFSNHQLSFDVANECYLYAIGFQQPQLLKTLEENYFVSIDLLKVCKNKKYDFRKQQWLNIILEGLQSIISLYQRLVESPTLHAKANLPLNLMILSAAKKLKDKIENKEARFNYAEIHIIKAGFFKPIYERLMQVGAENILENANDINLKRKK